MAAGIQPDNGNRTLSQQTVKKDKTMQSLEFPQTDGDDNKKSYTIPHLNKNFVEMSKYEPRDDQQTRHHAAQDKVNWQK